MQNLDFNQAIVDQNGRPTEYFMRLLQTRGVGQETLEDQVAALIAKQIIAGDGLDGGGVLGDPGNITLTADVQEILEQLSSTQGVVLYRGASGWQALVPGTANNVLRTSGAGTDPTWVALSTLLDQFSTTHGAVLYRGASAWQALAPGTSGQFLKTNGSGANPAWDTPSGGGGGGNDVRFNLMRFPAAFGTSGVTSVGAASTTTNTATLNYAATNSFTKLPQVRVGAASTNSFGQVRSTSALFQSGAGLTYKGQFGVHTAGANLRFVVGFQNSWSGTVDPSTSLDSFFVGKDSGDANLQIMHNDGAGSCTKIDLGSGFPANTSQTDHYLVELTILNGGASATYSVTRVNTGAVATGTISTNLPTTTVGMFAGQWGAAGATATGCYISFMGFNVQSPAS